MDTRRMKAGDDEVEPSPFEGLSRNAVLHETRCFHDQQIDPVKCARVMTKILYLISQGDNLSSREATDVFFACTKLFQSPDVHLRRMIYLLIKNLKVSSDESIIVVSCLSKDMTCKTDMFRANSIRVLARLIDAAMLGNVDRFLKQSIVDKNPFIVASALIGGLHLYPTGPDIVRRWVNEVQEALQSKNKMVQYHALTLLYKIKKHDRLAISKVVSSLARNPPSGPMAQCLLIRYLCSVLSAKASMGGQMDSDLIRFLTDSLQNRSFMVTYEAARALCRLPNLQAVQVAPAISVLQEFLTSPSPAQRFAAVRTLSQVVTRFPQLVAPCSVDLEMRITDPNRSIATLAITALLKTGVEANVDRLMKSITGFMSEITDEFKTVLVDAIKTLCLKFPHKHSSLMSFLASALREEGGKDYKTAIVSAMLDVVERVPEAKAEILDHFCEYIEDCEFSNLAVKILHLLGEEGSRCEDPSKYIRFVYNRTILETSAVRAAAVSALGKIGSMVPSMAGQITTLLKRSLNDQDDEVRDRVVLYLDMIDKQDEKLAGDINSALGVRLQDLELSLRLYMGKQHAHPFTIEQHLVQAEEEEVKTEDKRSPFGDDTPAVAADTTTEVMGNPYLELLSSIPEFKSLGPLYKSCAPVNLTEEESEYVVNCVKHIYAEHVVFQFNVTNNMEDQLLQQVIVQMDPEEEAWAEEVDEDVLIVPEPKIQANGSGATFVCMKRPSGTYVSGTIANELQFNYLEVENGDVVDDEDATDETYQLEEIEVLERDFVSHGTIMSLVDFRKKWEALGDTHEVVKKYSLGLDDLQAAVDAVMELLGMASCEESHLVPDDKRTHPCTFYGTFLGDIPVYCRAGFMLDQKHGVTLKMAIRCQDQSVATLFSKCIR